MRLDIDVDQALVREAARRQIAISALARQLIWDGLRACDAIDMSWAGDTWYRRHNELVDLPAGELRELAGSDGRGVRGTIQLAEIILRREGFVDE